MNWLKAYVMQMIFKDGLKEVEKLNLTTKALEMMYKQKLLKDSWQDVTDSIIALLNDCVDEVRQAKKWA